MNMTACGRVALGIAMTLPGSSAFADDRPQVPAGVEVRDGYQLSIVEASITTPRFMAMSPDGILYVSVPSDSRIKACRDTDGDGYFDKVTTFNEAGPSVHGLCWHDGWLWYSLGGAVHRTRDTDGDMVADETVKVLPEGTLPRGKGHWWRSILVHKGRIYTGIGDSGNATPTEDEHPERQKIWSFALDGSDRKLFASGVRNTEKLVIRPGTDEIWGMDHGSDFFGKEFEDQAEGDAQPLTDYNPPEEMNLYVEGGFYGHPFLTGDCIPRFEFLDRKDLVELASRTIVPMWCGGAHWASNAMTFYDADQFPDCKGDAFVAYHGSWNRSKPGGYCVTRVLFEKGKPYGELIYADFLEGERTVHGRPCDVLVDRDGSLLITDDNRNRIYRLKYIGEKK